MDAIGDNGHLNLEEVRALEVVWQGYTYFRENDVIVAKITPCFENGKGALCRNLVGGIGFGTTELHVLRPGDQVVAPFIFYLTKAYPFRNLGIASMQGAAGQKRVTDNFIKDFSVALPPCSEQKAVADFLDRETAQVDALLAKRQRLIELLQEKRAALITHAVTKGLPSTGSGQATPNVPMKDSGVEWLGEIPAHWEVRQLRRAVRKFVDYRGATPQKMPSGLPLVTAANIKNGQINFDEAEQFIAEEAYHEWMVRGLPEEGDVLLTTEAPLGETAQIEDPRIALAQRIILLKADSNCITNEFLKYHFAAGSGKAELWTKATGSTAVGIKAYHLRATLIAVPPLREQKLITKYLDNETIKIDSLIAKIGEGIEKLKEYRTALISAAVTGKIDVREDVVA
jgi:type I restriction enzyme S subunit